MSSERRERILRMLLPSLVIGVGYFVFVPRPDLVDLETKLVSARRAAKQAPPVGLSQRANRELEAKAIELREELSALVAGNTDAGRMQALHGIVDLLERHQVALVDETPGGGDGFALPHGLTELKAHAGLLRRGKRSRTPEPPAPGRQIWKLRLRGSYLSMLTALEELADRGPDAIPLSVGLEKLDSSGLHAWALVVWV